MLLLSRTMYFRNEGTMRPQSLKLRADDHVMTPQHDSVHLKASWITRARILDHRDSAVIYISCLKVQYAIGEAVYP